MIGLDSYSRQVFIYFDPILIYINLWIDLPSFLWMFSLFLKDLISDCSLYTIVCRLMSPHIRKASFSHLWSVTATPDPIKSRPIMLGHRCKTHAAGSAGDTSILDLVLNCNYESGQSNRCKSISWVNTPCRLANWKVLLSYTLSAREGQIIRL